MSKKCTQFHSERCGLCVHEVLGKSLVKGPVEQNFAKKILISRKSLCQPHIILGLNLTSEKGPESCLQGLTAEKHFSIFYVISSYIFELVVSALMFLFVGGGLIKGYRWKKGLIRKIIS